MLTTNFLNVEEKMQKYPKLIYDGPFSEHIEQQKPNLKGKNITSQQAQRIAASFLEDQKYRAKEIGEIQNNSIPGYLIALSPAQDQEGNYSEISVAVSKTGGKIIWLLNNREIGKAKISEEEGIEIAKKFLEKKGYPNMLPTYFEKNDGQLLVNFAYQENGVIVYTDLIKVKVGLDKGDIIGFESAGYLHNHRMRNIGPPEISEEEARKRIHVFAEPSKPRLAIIPTEGGKEVLCYEFKVQFGQDTFLIYIDANNGEEQKILQLLIQDGGVLVI